MGHTVAVFFLLSIYSSVVARWAKQLSALPNIKHLVRSVLDLLSDFTFEPLKFSTVVAGNNGDVPKTNNLEIGGAQ